MRSKNGVIEFSIKTQKQNGKEILSISHFLFATLLEGRGKKREDKPSIGVSAVSRC
jgi:hypothetical protein